MKGALHYDTCQSLSQAVGKAQDPLVLWIPLCDSNMTPLLGLAFLKDPDGYLIEVLPRGKMLTKEVDCAGIRLDGDLYYKDDSKRYF